MQVGAVTCIDFSPLYPYNYAVTSSTRVIIFDALTRRPLTTLSRFKDKAYSGTFRSDGRLLVAGGETGIVQVMARACAVGTCDPSMLIECTGPAFGSSLWSSSEESALLVNHCTTRYLQGIVESQSF